MSWTKMKLGDAATFINGYPFKPSDWKTEGKEIIRIQNLTGRGNDINYFDGKIPEKYKVRKGDLLISWSATLGIFEWDREDAWLNQHIFKVVFNKIEFDKSFFKHLISTVLLVFGQKVHGSTMKHITKVNFDKTIISLPPLFEQKRIAEILDKADALRQKNKQLLAAYDELLQATFLELFGDPVTNPKGWKEYIIENISNVQGGLQVSFKRNSLPLQVPYLRVANIYRNQLDLKEIKKIGLTENEFYRTLLIKGDILIVEGHGNKLEIGRSAIWDGSIKGCVHQNHLIRVRVDNSKMTSVFLSFFINSEGGRRQMFKTSNTTSGLNTISTGIVNQIKVINPPITLQNQFAQIVENIEAQKTLVKQCLQESEDLFNGLVQEAFGGEL